MSALIKFFTACTLILSLTANASTKAAPKVLLKTTLGDVTVELYPEKAPKTVANFLQYVEDRHYDGLLFHRIIPGFMVQTGGYTFDFQERETRDDIVNESIGGLKNTYKTLAMARTSDPDSASSQFFVNLVANPHLDADGDKPGYTVFGKVIEGMEVIELIAVQPQGKYRNTAFHNAPNKPIQIIKAEVVKPKLIKLY